MQPLESALPPHGRTCASCRELGVALAGLMVNVHDKPAGRASGRIRRGNRQVKAAPSNLVLIGMPGSGKSTVGVILAKRTARDFVDTDLLIQNAQQRTLQTIVDTDGPATLRKIEESILLDLHVRNHVIATGGSAVYSDRAMAHLKADGLAIFIDVDLALLEARIHDYSTRGLAKRPEQSFVELFDERFGLYTRYADITIKCVAGMTQDDVCAQIIAKTEPPKPSAPLPPDAIGT